MLPASSLATICQADVIAAATSLTTTAGDTAAFAQAAALAVTKCESSAVQCSAVQCLEVDCRLQTVPQLSRQGVLAPTSRNHSAGLTF